MIFLCPSLLLLFSPPPLGPSVLWLCTHAEQLTIAIGNHGHLMSYTPVPRPSYGSVHMQYS